MGDNVDNNEFDNLDEFKKIVNNMFGNLSGKVPDITPDNIPPNLEMFAIEKTLEELEQVRAAFVDFQTSVNGLVVSNYFVNQIEKFAQYAEDLTNLIENTIDETTLDKDTLLRFKSLQQIRAQILSRIINKYNEEEN